MNRPTPAAPGGALATAPPARLRCYHAQTLDRALPVAVRACSSPDALSVTLHVLRDATYVDVLYPASLTRPKLPRGHWYDVRAH
jgi:hypothetical protein